MVELIDDDRRWLDGWLEESDFVRVFYYVHTYLDNSLLTLLTLFNYYRMNGTRLILLILLDLVHLECRSSYCTCSIDILV